VSSDPNCIFCKIIDGKIPSKKAYEDEDVFVFHDIAPWAPVHLLVVPKRHIASMAQLSSDDAALMGKIMTLAPRLALEQVVNTGIEGGQEVHHLHVHVMGGPRPWLKG
jgi:histidine triad (HIT) family protein